MKFSTGQKRRSRLQGHRKRRRKLRVTEAPGAPEVSWLEYKTMRQYPSMGELLDQMRQYGYRGGIESMAERGWEMEVEGLYEVTIDELLKRQ